MAQSFDRAVVTTTDTFISVPSAWDGAPAGIKHVAKMAVDTKDDRGTSSQVINTNLILFDLGALDPSSFSLEPIGRDVELLTEAVRSHPKQLQEILHAYTDTSGPRDDAFFARNRRLLEQMGLTERQVVDSGGGLIFLIVLCVFLGGCMAHCKGSVRQP